MKTTLKLTAYATELLEYVKRVSAKEFDAEGYLDTYIPDWRSRKSAPKPNQHVVISTVNEDE